MGSPPVLELGWRCLCSCLLKHTVQYSTVQYCTVLYSITELCTDVCPHTGCTCGERSRGSFLFCDSAPPQNLNINIFLHNLGKRFTCFFFGLNKFLRNNIYEYIFSEKKKKNKK